MHGNQGGRPVRQGRSQGVNGVRKGGFEECRACGRSQHRDFYTVEPRPSALSVKMAWFRLALAPALTIGRSGDIGMKRARNSAQKEDM